MTSCPNPLALDICPTQEQLQPQILALLPRGRAWGEGGPAREPGGVIYQFWFAVAGLYAQLHAAICQLALEFFCQTETLTNATWLEEYGLPDGCEPFPNLCVKVAALGGVTCAFYQEIAASLGWSITCGQGLCSQPVGSLFAVGCTPVGATVSSGILVVVVNLPESPAFTGAQSIGTAVGLYRAGLANSCGPDITALSCTLRRIVGAWVQIDFVFVGT
jgi:hypothetical protein